MIKLKGYLKPFAGVLAIVLVLLFVQAMCDLNLPNYMSDIVNIGIQKNGIKNATPAILSEDGYVLLTSFMTEEERATVEQHYKRTTGDNEDYIKEYTFKTPLSAEDNIYICDQVDNATQENLNSIFGKATWTFINTMQELSRQNTDAQQNTEETADLDLNSVDIQEIYSMIPVIQNLPPSIIEDAREQAEKMDDSLREQTGSALVKLLYEELGIDVGVIQRNYIFSIGTIMLLITLLGAAAAISVGFCSSRLAAGVSRNLRKDIFKKVESFSNAEFDKFSTSSLITRTTNDITQIQQLLVMSVRMLLYAPITGVGGVIMILQKNSSMTWIIALAVVILMALILVVFVTAMPKFKLTQKLIDKLNLVSRENLNGIMVVRAFGNQKFEENRFNKANQDLTDTNLFINRIIAGMMPIMMLVMNLITLLIVWIGAHQIEQSTMQVGDMMAFMQYAMQVIFAFVMIAAMFILVPRASVSAERIAEVLNTEPVIQNPATSKEFIMDKQGYVEFKDVCFQYLGAEEDVLSNITFTAKPGETTAFIGSTGSGKSTLINLIPRFYDVTAGEVCVNGVDVRKITQHQLRKEIGYVPQKGVLLSGTIDFNLKYGRPEATDDEMKEAAEIAQARAFIEQKDEQYKSLIAEGGSNVSGGQKQRLSIARALVKEAPICIFDDSFSALDFKTEAILQRELKEKMSEKTVIIVAQRVSTIMSADQIIVLDEGRIVGKGRHRELLHTCPTYFEIASSQMSEEELA